MGEIEPEPVGGDQRPSLNDVLSQDLPQGSVEEMGSSVVPLRIVPSARRPPWPGPAWGPPDLRERSLQRPSPKTAVCSWTRPNLLHLQSPAIP